MNNEVEKIIGTAFDNPDTDGDRIRDLAELQQGLNPFDARPFPTGIISTLPLFGTANEVVIEGSLISSEAQTAYVATGTGLAIVDVTQFDNPIVLGQLDLSNASDVAIDSVRNIAAVAGSDGLHLVDVSDPMLPTLIQTIDVPANQVEVIEGVAYVTVNGPAGSQIVAYDVLTGDKLDATVSIATKYVSLAREGLMLYTMDSARTLRVIDASGFFMQSRGSLELPRQPNKIWAGGGVVYAPSIPGVGGGRGGYLTIDVGDPDAPLLMANGLSDEAAVTGPGGDFVANGAGIGLLIGGVGPIPAVLDVYDTTASPVTDSQGNPHLDSGAFLTRFVLPSASSRRDRVWCGLCCRRQRAG